MDKSNRIDDSVEDSIVRATKLRQASMCRLCFKNKYLVSIGSDQEFIEHLTDFLPHISSSDAENLPDFVCGECYQMVETMSQFKVRCSRASKIMRKYIRKGGKFPEKEMLEERPRRRAEKRAASTKRDQPAAKRRRTKEIITKDENCNEVVDEAREDALAEYDTEKVKEFNPEKLAAKIDELFGTCEEFTAQVLQRNAEELRDDEVISVNNPNNFVPLSKELKNLKPNPWIEALHEEVLYSILVNQLMEIQNSVKSCRSYTSVVDSYVELQ